MLALPLPERLRIAQKLIESVLKDSSVNGANSVSGIKSSEATGIEAPDLDSAPDSKPANALISLLGRYHGGSGNTADNYKQILLEEIDPRSGFTIKK